MKKPYFWLKKQTMPAIHELEKIAAQVRRDVLRMVHAVQSGHPGGALGATEFMVALYFEIMNHRPDNFTMEGSDEDLFFLSNGHLSAAWYSVLARSGYFNIQELSTFRKLNSRLQGHPATAEGIPGVRIASGSLGQGLSVSIGAAVSKKLNGDKGLVFTLMGDGEMDEGQIWEASMYAAGKKVDNLIATIDNNGQQIDGPTDKVMPLGSLKNKWEAFGWDVIEMPGNDMTIVVEGLNNARQRCGKGKPVAIIMHSEMGHGVDFMAGTHHWHGVPPDNDQLARALAQLEESLGDY
ncbi:MAG: transketolase [Bacteroidetes bacterium]|nr:MAG: transketolase [Bacteroidota bacterium]